MNERYEQILPRGNALLRPGRDDGVDRSRARRFSLDGVAPAGRRDRSGAHHHRRGRARRRRSPGPCPDAFGVRVPSGHPARGELAPVAHIDQVAQRAAGLFTEIVGDDMNIEVAWGITTGCADPPPAPQAAHRQRHRPDERRGQPEVVGGALHRDHAVHRGRTRLLGVVLFPVPAFFDHPETKEAMWREAFGAPRRRPALTPGRGRVRGQFADRLDPSTSTPRGTSTTTSGWRSPPTVSSVTSARCCCARTAPTPTSGQPACHRPDPRRTHARAAPHLRRGRSAARPGRRGPARRRRRGPRPGRGDGPGDATAPVTRLAVRRDVRTVDPMANTTEPDQRPRRRLLQQGQGVHPGHALHPHQDRARRGAGPGRRR